MLYQIPLMSACNTNIFPSKSQVEISILITWTGSASQILTSFWLLASCECIFYIPYSSICYLWRSLPIRYTSGILSVATNQGKSSSLCPAKLMTCTVFPKQGVCFLLGFLLIRSIQYKSTGLCPIKTHFSLNGSNEKDTYIGQFCSSSLFTLCSSFRVTSPLTFENVTKTRRVSIPVLHLGQKTDFHLVSSLHSILVPIPLSHAGS